METNVALIAVQTRKRMRAVAYTYLTLPTNREV